MNLNEQQRRIGQDNFFDALKLTRRNLFSALVAVPSATAFYWGYERLNGSPVRAALIGAGGQGRSHIDSINPQFLKLVTGRLNPVTGVMRGQLKVRGDVKAALTFSGLMDIPGA